MMGGLARAVQQLARSCLSVICRSGVPGRYTAVELVSAWLSPSDRVTARIGRTLQYRCDLRDQVQRQIYYGLYEEDETRFILTQLKAGNVFLDIGANVGYYTLLAAEIVGEGGRVHAFEPIPSNCATLREMVAENRLINVEINQVAVSDGCEETTTLYLREGADSSGLASIARSPTAKNLPISVSTTSLDNYVREKGVKHISLIKLDIEGAEPLAVRGGTALLASADAPDIVMEINPFLLARSGSSPSQLKGLLVAHGYTLYPINPHGLGAALAVEANEKHLINVFATKRVRAEAGVS